MKTRQEIEAASKRVKAILDGEAPVSPIHRHNLEIAASVLFWALNDPRGCVFEGVLEVSTRGGDLELRINEEMRSIISAVSKKS